MHRLFRTLVTIAVIKVVVLAALAAVFLVGMRTKSPVVQDRVRRFNKAVGNPQAMKTAGRVGARMSVVQHVGRTSGASYETPVEAHPVGDGFLIALPYGAGADWVKNVLAGGSAMILRDGATVRVDRPEVVSTSFFADQLPAREQRTLRLFDVTQCLRVRTAASGEPA